MGFGEKPLRRFATTQASFLSQLSFVPTTNAINNVSLFLFSASRVTSYIMVHIEEVHGPTDDPDNAGPLRESVQGSNDDSSTNSSMPEVLHPDDEVDSDERSDDEADDDSFTATLFNTGGSVDGIHIDERSDDEADDDSFTATPLITGGSVDGIHNFSEFDVPDLDGNPAPNGSLFDPRHSSTYRRLIHGIATTAAHFTSTLSFVANFSQYRQLLFLPAFIQQLCRTGEIWDPWRPKIWKIYTNIMSHHGLIPGATVVLNRANDNEHRSLIDQTNSENRIVDSIGRDLQAIGSLGKLVLHGNSLSMMSTMLNSLSLFWGIGDHFKYLTLVFGSTTIINDSLLVNLHTRLWNFLNINHTTKALTVSSHHAEIIRIAMELASQRDSLNFHFIIGSNTPIDVNWDSYLWQRLADNERSCNMLPIDFGANHHTVRNYINVVTDRKYINVLFYQRWAYSTEQQYINSAKMVFNGISDSNTVISHLQILGKDMCDDLALILHKFVKQNNVVPCLHIAYERGYGPMGERQSADLLDAMRSNYRIIEFKSRFDSISHYDTLQNYVKLNRKGRKKLFDHEKSETEKQLAAIDLIEQINVDPICSESEKIALKHILLKDTPGLFANK